MHLVGEVWERAWRGRTPRTLKRRVHTALARRVRLDDVVARTPALRRCVLLGFEGSGACLVSYHPAHTDGVCAGDMALQVWDFGLHPEFRVRLRASVRVFQAAHSARDVGMGGVDEPEEGGVEEVLGGCLPSPLVMFVGQKRERGMGGHDLGWLVVAGRPEHVGHDTNCPLHLTVLHPRGAGGTAIVATHVCVALHQPFPLPSAAHLCALPARAQHAVAVNTGDGFTVLVVHDTPNQRWFERGALCRSSSANSASARGDRAAAAEEGGQQRRRGEGCPVSEPSSGPTPVWWQEAELPGCATVTFPNAGDSVDTPSLQTTLPLHATVAAAFRFDLEQYLGSVVRNARNIADYDLRIVSVQPTAVLASLVVSLEAADGQQQAVVHEQAVAVEFTQGGRVTVLWSRRRAEEACRTQTVRARSIALMQALGKGLDRGGVGVWTNLPVLRGESLKALHNPCVPVCLVHDEDEGCA